MSLRLIINGFCLSLILPVPYILPVMKNGKACFFDSSMIEHLLGPILIPQIDLVLLYLLPKFQPYTSSIGWENEKSILHTHMQLR